MTKPVYEDMPPMARARRLAKERCLLGVNFFDKEGKPARGKRAVSVELRFEGDVVVLLTQRELIMLRDVHFNLKEQL